MKVRGYNLYFEYGLPVCWDTGGALGGRCAAIRGTLGKVGRYPGISSRNVFLASKSFGKRDIRLHLYTIVVNPRETLTKMPKERDECNVRDIIRMAAEKASRIKITEATLEHVSSD